MKKNVFSILLALLFFGNLSAQLPMTMTEGLDLAYQQDSILLENSVEFHIPTDRDGGEMYMVRFKIKVTNLGDRPIPNLMRVSNRSLCLQIWYNGKQGSDLSFHNGLEGPDMPRVLGKGESDTWASGWSLRKDSGIFIQAGGHIVDVKWKYLDVFSDEIRVDLKAHKVIETEE